MRKASLLMSYGGRLSDVRAGAGAVGVGFFFWLMLL